MGGAPVFAGTRVQVETLFRYLRDGNMLDEFLTDYPSVTREAAVAVIARAEHVRDAIGSAAIEGSGISAETRALMDRYVESEITIEEVITAVSKMYGPRKA